MTREYTPLIVALDYLDTKSALEMARKLDPSQCRVKVGKALFTAEGPQVIDALHQLGFEVFLDLKFHDIPQTVASACRAAANLGVWMLNVHGLGGVAMLEAAREALELGQHKPILIGVTLLTSFDATQFGQLGLSGPMEDYVLKLAGLVHQAGLDGVVCSAQEAALLRQQFGSDFKLVSPGIRFVESEAHDQKRIMTPDLALAEGVDYLVMGRAITRSEDPTAQVQRVLANSF